MPYARGPSCAQLTAASIAAGSQHSLATQASGAVAAWGYNATGQLGDGTTTRRLTPITVPNLPGVDTVAGGETRSLALSPDDAVWTWGGNANGQLGDGTTTQQTGGIPVSGTQLTWAVVAPTATPAAGSFTTTTEVTLATVTPGATVHYTTNGSEPTEADATFVAGPPIAVDGTLTIKAKAWKTGLTPSPTSTLVYTLRSVTPTLTPAPTGSPFTSAQTVTLATTTSGAEIRYTLDGTTPTSSSALYASALTIATGTTLKALAFKSGWSASTEASGVYAFNYGTLAAPTANPAGGSYTAAQTVTLTADAGATILYTLDGSEPLLGAGSTAVYSAPLVVHVTTTLKSRAVRVDWTASSVRTDTFTITDTTPPLITASVSPSANGAGWHTSTVTVSFTCSDAGSGIEVCPSAITQSDEGIDVVVSGTARDYAGNTATATVTVDIDTHAPWLSVATPRQGAVVPAGVFTVVGAVSDGVSAVADVTCNGAPATFTASQFSCDVTLVEGLNALTVEATDGAGQVTTINRDVNVGTSLVPAPTSLHVSPATRAVAIGQVATFLATDDAARDATGGVWTSSNPAIAAVSATTPGEVTAVAAGTATISVLWHGLSASATVTVLPAGGVPDGTLLWTAQGPGGSEPATLIEAVPASENGPELFAVNEEAGSVRALMRDGRVLWAFSLGETIIHAAADNEGGLLLNTGVSLTRVDGTWGDAVWRYTVRPDRPGLSEVAVHPDNGLVYAVGEATDGPPFLVALTASGGGVASRTPLSDFAGFCGVDATCGGWHGHPAIDEGGAVNIIAVTTNRLSVEEPMARRVYRLRAQGSTRTATVLQTYMTGVCQTPWPNRAMPDDTGGVWVTWIDSATDGCSTVAWAVQVLADGTIGAGTGMQLMEPVWEEMLLSAGGIFTGRVRYGYPKVKRGIIRISTTGSGLQPQPDNSENRILGAVGSGDVLVDTPAGPRLSAEGLDLSSLSLRAATLSFENQLVGSTGATIASQVGPDLWFSQNAAPLPGGNAGRQNAPYTLTGLDWVAVRVLQQLNPYSVQRNTEYAGRICRTPSGRFMATKENYGQYSDTVPPRQCDPNNVAVALYHTHGTYGNLGHSSGDIILANSQAVHSYMANYCGYIVKYDVLSASQFGLPGVRTRSVRSGEPQCQYSPP
ncbi:MAG: chitobiase/beta-hexosaminidase C-terminal domain-containing protein [Vicinamibacterales bacterium]